MPHFKVKTMPLVVQKCQFAFAGLFLLLHKNNTVPVPPCPLDLCQSGHVSDGYFFHWNFEEKSWFVLFFMSETCRNSFFLYWNFDKNCYFVVFFQELNECKNLQFNFSSQNFSLERNFFKWDGKVTKIWHLLFHRIWKNNYFKKEQDI